MEVVTEMLEDADVFADKLAATVTCLDNGLTEAINAVKRHVAVEGCAVSEGDAPKARVFSLKGSSYEKKRCLLKCSLRSSA